MQPAEVHALGAWLGPSNPQTSNSLSGSITENPELRIRKEPCVLTLEALKEVEVNSHKEITRIIKD